MMMRNTIQTINELKDWWIDDGNMVTQASTAILLTDAIKLDVRQSINLWHQLGNALTLLWWAEPVLSK